MKKVLGIILVLLLVLGISSCKKQPSETITDSNSETNVTETTHLETTTQPKRLSEECTYILTTAYDGDDYYELVANQTEDYAGAKIEVGVIKNNVWVLEPTSNMPFIGSNGALKNGTGIDGAKKCFCYIGKGVFLFSYDYKFPNMTISNTLDIIYNSATKESYECNDKHISLVKFKEYRTGEQIFTYPNCDYIILNRTRYAGFYSLTLLNFITMETKTLELSTKGFPADTDRIYPISDGTIAIVGGKHIRFYDTDGNIPFDGEFNYTSIPFDGDAFVMKNGKCRFSVKNNNGTTYDIAINKYGEVIEQLA